MVPTSGGGGLIVVYPRRLRTTTGAFEELRAIASNSHLTTLRE